MSEASMIDLAVLVFAPFGKDGQLVERVLRQSGITVRSLASLPELEVAVREDAGAAIITEEVLQNGAIASLAQRVSAQPPWSDFPIIVLTGSGLSTTSTESAV